MWRSLDNTWSARFLAASRLGTAATHLVGVVCVWCMWWRKKCRVVLWSEEGAEDVSNIVVQEDAVCNLLLVLEGCLVSVK